MAIEAYEQAYEVNVTQDGKQKSGVLAFAQEEDIPSGWTMDWLGIWKSRGSEGTTLAKLSVNKSVVGLVEYAVSQTDRYVLFVNHIEARPDSVGKNVDRFVEPVGKWLFWYCVNLVLENHKNQDQDPVIVLFATDQAFSYYKDIVKMTYTGESITLNGGKVHVFHFSRKGAEEFASEVSKRYGLPRQAKS